jgi:hypothetical protein
MPSPFFIPYRSRCPCPTPDIPDPVDPHELPPEMMANAASLAGPYISNIDGTAWSMKGAINAITYSSSAPVSASSGVTASTSPVDYGCCT